MKRKKDQTERKMEAQVRFDATPRNLLNLGAGSTSRLESSVLGLADPIFSRCGRFECISVVSLHHDLQSNHGASMACAHSG